jgi:5-methylcytosine-specific restriction enzyme A
MAHDTKWDHWYSLQRWRRRRRHQLLTHPLCAMCLQRGLVVAATVADHVEHHQGNANLFWFGKLQSLCSPCHDSRKRAVDIRGYDAAAIDADGWPLDPNHPANSRRGIKRASDKSQSQFFFARKKNLLTRKKNLPAGGA